MEASRNGSGESLGKGSTEGSKKASAETSTTVAPLTPREIELIIQNRPHRSSAVLGLAVPSSGDGLLVGSNHRRSQSLVEAPPRRLSDTPSPTSQIFFPTCVQEAPTMVLRCPRCGGPHIPNQTLNLFGFFLWAAVTSAQGTNANRVQVPDQPEASTRAARVDWASSWRLWYVSIAVTGVAIFISWVLWLFWLH